MMLHAFDKLMYFIVALYLILQSLNFSSFPLKFSTLPLALTPEALDFSHNALVFNTHSLVLKQKKLHDKMFIANSDNK